MEVFLLQKRLFPKSIWEKEDSTMELSFVREDKPTTRAEDGAMDGGIVVKTVID